MTTTMLPYSTNARRKWHQRLLAYSVGIITIASIIPQNIVTSTVLFHTIGLDKIIHFLAFSVVTVLALFVSLSSRLWKITIIVLVVMLFGATVEIIQSTIPYRTFNPLDILANLIGVICGIFLWLLFKRSSLFTKERQRHAL
jgi:hypothetical protein